MKEVVIQTNASVETIVDESKLACHVGSGIVNVYATPMMIALMEQAAVECLSPFMDKGETSVGVLMNATHDAATPCGMKVSATATITAIDRKKITFEVIAKDEKDVIGKGMHERFIIKKEAFEQKALDKLK